MMLARPSFVVLSIALLVAIGCDRKSRPSDKPNDPAPSATVVQSKSAAPVDSAEPAPTASAEPPPLPEPEVPPPLPKALAENPPAPGSREHVGFKGPVDRAKDRAWIARLSSAPIIEITKNSGGATLTLRVRFSDGQKAVLKPEQSRSGASARAEIAAYHVDRLLGFGRTAVVVGRRFGLAHVRQHLEHSKADPAYLERFDREIKSENGKITGSLVAWHAGSLVSAEPPKEWLTELAEGGAPSPEVSARLPEWSDLMLFDFLIDNTDRWSGGNILSIGKQGGLIFLDNAAGFSEWRAVRGDTLNTKLEPLCRFRRASVSALRAADGKLGGELKSSLARDPLAPVLGERQFRALDERLTKLIAHVDQCIKRYGEENVLSL